MRDETDIDTHNEPPAAGASTGLTGMGALALSTPAPWPYGEACFICLRTFDEAVKMTGEDVVPRWLVRLMGGGRAAADLPNGQVVAYSRRKVPCCLDCNGRMSRVLEIPVSAAFKAGYDEVVSLDPRILFLWLAKLFYGTRFFETGRRVDVADPTSEAMLELESLLAQHEFLRKCLHFEPARLSFSAPPASMFVFRAGIPEQEGHQIDFFVPTTPPSSMIAVRLRDVFVVAVFGDNGHWGSALGGIRVVEAAMSEITLHPTQCTDIMLWFAAEIGAYESSGCYDLFVLGGPDGTSSARFAPQFVVERNDAPEQLLNRMRAATLMHRIGITPDESVLALAQNGHVPSTLVNPASDSLVQASCYELRCVGVLIAAGWTTTGPSCDKCGA